MRATLVASLAVSSCSALHNAAFTLRGRAVRPRMTAESPPPAGFEWATDVPASDVPATAASDAPEAAVTPVYDALVEGMTPAGEDGSCPLPPQEEYYCNEQGCWVGTPPPMEPVTLPDGRTFCMDVGVEAHSSINERKKIPTGIFAPVVLGAVSVMGRKELNALRAQVIAEHSKVISAFVDTSDSKFGQIVLKRMFEAADKDGNGTLDKQEIKDALHALGFTFVEDKQINQIFKRADLDGNEVIDFDEFVKDTPKTLRSSLIKLAKTNGHDLGFLA